MKAIDLHARLTKSGEGYDRMITEMQFCMTGQGVQTNAARHDILPERSSVNRKATLLQLLDEFELQQVDLAYVAFGRITAAIKKMSCCRAKMRVAGNPYPATSSIDPARVFENPWVGCAQTAMTSGCATNEDKQPPDFHVAAAGPPRRISYLAAA
jgi:hypothetical protein